MYLEIDSEKTTLQAGDVIAYCQHICLHFYRNGKRMSIKVDNKSEHDHVIHANMRKGHSSYVLATIIAMTHGLKIKYLPTDSYPDNTVESAYVFEKR